MSLLRDDHLLFFFNDTATTEIYTLSLHDALPISPLIGGGIGTRVVVGVDRVELVQPLRRVVKVTQIEDQIHPRLDLIFKDRKSTRLNSSHPSISYAVFCLKKKKKDKKYS